MDVEGLREPLEQFVRRVAHKFQVTAAFHRQVVLPEFRGDQISGSYVALVPDTSPLVTALVREAHTWPEVGHILQFVSMDPRLSRTLLTDAAAQPLRPEYRSRGLTMPLAYFAGDYVKQATPTPSRENPIVSIPNKWDPEVFRMLADVFLLSMRAGQTRVNLWAPLYHLGCSGEAPIALGDAWFVKDPDARVRLELPSPIDERSWIYFPRYYLTTFQSIGLRELPQDPTQAFRLHATAIRVAIGGEARVGDIVPLREPGGAVPFGTAFVPSFLGGPRPQLGEHQLSMIVTGQEFLFSEQVQALGRIQADYAVALNRYNLANERVSPEDRVIDATIGLEHILLPDTADELALRFALRGASLLGRTFAERRNWFNKLRQVYAYRSDLVHGNPKSLTTPRPEVAEYAMEALRLLLAVVSKQRLSRKEWNKMVAGIPLGPSAHEGEQDEQPL